MTRSDLNPNLATFNPEIERTLRLIRTARRRLFDTSFVEDNSTDNSSVFVSSSVFECASVHSIHVSKNSDFAENMANTHDRTLKELAAPDVNYQALAIQYPDLDVF